MSETKVDNEAYQKLMLILNSKPDYLHTPKEELPFIVQRVEKRKNPLSALKFEPNLIARKVFSFDSFLEAVRWRIINKRINNRMGTGEVGEGKTSVAIMIALLQTKWKEENRKKLKGFPKQGLRFSVNHNILLGQFETLQSQLIFNRFNMYEEIIADESELMFHRMRSSSKQNLDAKNMLDSGRSHYCPLTAICPSIGSIDKDISSTKMNWNIIAEFCSHKKKKVKVIIKYNVHSRDNYEYRWVDFSEMLIDWCPEDLYNESEKKKKRMIATYEGLKSKKAHHRQEMNKLEEKALDEFDQKAKVFLDQWDEDLISKFQCAWEIHQLTKQYSSDGKPNMSQVVRKLGVGSWTTANNWVGKWQRKLDKESEGGIIDEDKQKEIID